MKRAIAPRRPPLIASIISTFYSVSIERLFQRAARPDRWLTNFDPIDEDKAGIFVRATFESQTSSFSRPISRVLEWKFQPLGSLGASRGKRARR